jgi:hypothetical protein
MKSSLKLSVSIVASLVFLWLILGRATPARMVQAQEPIGAEAVRDDEIVLLDSSGHVKVVDPWAPPGYKKVDFTSAESGWTRVATGDVNGDGDDEVIAFKSTGVRVYDPVVPAGKTAANAVVVGSIAPYAWTGIATGDFDADGRDEIALLRTDGGDDIQGSIYIYNGNTKGTTWSLIDDSSYVIAWDTIGVGQFDNVAGDDIVVSRYDSDNSTSLLSLRRGNDTATTIAELGSVGRWKSVAGGQVNTATARSEVLATRDVDPVYYSFYVFTSQLDDNYYLEDYFYKKADPYFYRVAAGDINGDGDDEAVLWRNSAYPDVVIYNPPASAAMRQLDTGTSWRGMATGDTDGDGRDEVILVRNDRYRIYNSPESSDDFTDYTGGSWRDHWDPIATGNIDGKGVPGGGVEMDIQIGEELTAPIVIQQNNASGSNPITWTTQHSPTSANWFAVIPNWGVLISSAPVTPSVLITGDMLSLSPTQQSKTYQADLLVVFSQTTTTAVQTTTLPIKAIVSWPSMAVFPSSLNFSIAATDTVISFTKIASVTQRMGQGHGVVWEAHTVGGIPVSALDFPLPSWITMSPLPGTQHNTPSVITLTFSGTFTKTQSPYLAGISFIAPFTVTSNTQELTIRMDVADQQGLIYLPLVLKGSSQ